AIRIVGGCYLIYLGVQLLREASASAVHDHAAEPAPAGHAFVMGLMVNLTNPKAVVLFASVFATAVTPATPIWVIGAMIALVSGLTFVWYTAVAVVIAAPAVLDRFAQGSNWIERIAGVCFIGFGGKVLADSRNPIGA
ncbi:MAG: LysE family transporter, partial [Pseudomonadota bacterium]